MRRVEIATADGSADAWVCTPQGEGAWPPVILYMDAIGVRPGLLAMAERLAHSGYCVLLPNLYYRAGRRPPFDPVQALTDETQRAQMLALYQSLDQRLVMRDTQAFLGFLAAQAAVRGPGAGCVGYCMGGGFALAAAGAFPERIVAAASFHGARLATAHPLSPHRLADRIRAALYIGVAETDPWLEPGETERLRDALEAARVRHTIEIYPGTQHGFTLPDLPARDVEAAERHWQRLREFLAQHLSP